MLLLASGPLSPPKSRIICTPNLIVNSGHKRHLRHDPLPSNETGAPGPPHPLRGTMNVQMNLGLGAQRELNDPGRPQSAGCVVLCVTLPLYNPPTSSNCTRSKLVSFPPSL